MAYVDTAGYNWLSILMECISRLGAQVYGSCTETATL